MRRGEKSRVFFGGERGGGALVDRFVYGLLPRNGLRGRSEGGVGGRVLNKGATTLARLDVLGSTYVEKSGL